MVLRGKSRQGCFELLFKQKPSSNLLPCVIPSAEPPPSQTPLHTVAPVRKREELTFEDDGDDLMDALGFGNGPKGDEKQGKKAEE